MAQTDITPAITVPTTVSGDSNYELLGCYNDLPPSLNGIIPGALGSYISPVFASNEALTVPLCLEGCRVASMPNGGGHYMYAGVETRFVHSPKPISFPS